MQMGRSVPMYVVYCYLFVLLALLTSCICYTHMRVTAHGLARIHCWASPRTPSTEILAEWCLVQGAAWASRHSMICRRKTWFGKSSKILSGAPVLGLVLPPPPPSPFSPLSPSTCMTLCPCVSLLLSLPLSLPPSPSLSAHERVSLSS